jgi:hypothetical protein
MTPEDEPTEEGKRRYTNSTPVGHYCANTMPGPACTCKPECEDPCCGDCGCKACWEAYSDAMSSPDE